MGEAAGIAAAYCNKNSFTPNELAGSIVSNRMQQYLSHI
jgi:hypothetical protein